MTIKRTYDDYAELGDTLCAAREALTQSLLLASPMFGKAHRHTNKLYRLLGRLNQIRSDVDDDFCREFQESDIPEGRPRFPIYR